MDRVLSLINKLSVQAQSKAPLADLLATTELLRSELSAEVDAEQLKINNAVAVWLPVGYHKQNQAGNGQAAERTAVKKEPPEEKSGKSSEETTEASPAVHAEQPAAPPIHRVPSPPSKIVSVAEPAREEQPQEEEKPPSTENKAEKAEEKIPQQYFQVHLTDEDPDPVIPSRFSGVETTHAATPSKPAPEPKHQPEPETPKQRVFVSPPAPEKQEPANEPAKTQKRPFPEYPEDAESLMKKIFPLSTPPSKPSKEVNELVVDPTVQLNQKLQEKKVELGEVLGAGPKITDIRKAISINDRYQMINSLFRNDEVMFERSIRTLNNFGSLPEARYWMQRELVLKLAWDENDELVQQFYKLVSRRFA